MLELRHHFPLVGLLRLAGLARSSFYYQQEALQASDKHCDLKTKIREVFNRHRGRYGYRRITAELKRQGSGVNHKTVQRLMVAMQLKSLVRPKRYKAFDGAVAETAPNHLQRDFKAEQPNEKWVTDVTEFKVNNRKLYLSPVMDLYNREIVPYEIAERPLPTMIESMLTKAFDPAEVIAPLRARLPAPAEDLSGLVERDRPTQNRQQAPARPARGTARGKRC